MVLDEYAIRVYAMVEHDLHFDAEDKLFALLAARSSNSNPQNLRSLVNSLERASRDILEEETVDMNKLKKVLNKDG